MTVGGPFLTRANASVRVAFYAKLREFYMKLGFLDTIRGFFLILIYSCPSRTTAVALIPAEDVDKIAAPAPSTPRDQPTSSAAAAAPGVQKAAHAAAKRGLQARRTWPSPSPPPVRKKVVARAPAQKDRDWVRGELDELLGFIVFGLQSLLSDVAHPTINLETARMLWTEMALNVVPSDQLPGALAAIDTLIRELGLAREEAVKLRSGKKAIRQWTQDWVRDYMQAAGDAASDLARALMWPLKHVKLPPVLKVKYWGPDKLGMLSAHAVEALPFTSVYDQNLPDLVFSLGKGLPFMRALAPEVRYFMAQHGSSAGFSRIAERMMALRATVSVPAPAAVASSAVAGAASAAGSTGLSQQLPRTDAEPYAPWCAKDHPATEFDPLDFDPAWERKLDRIRARDRARSKRQRSLIEGHPPRRLHEHVDTAAGPAAAESAAGPGPASEPAGAGKAPAQRRKRQHLYECKDCGTETASLYARCPTCEPEAPTAAAGTAAAGTGDSTISSDSDTEPYSDDGTGGIEEVESDAEASTVHPVHGVVVAAAASSSAAGPAGLALARVEPPPFDWTCTLCGFYNNGRHSICRACTGVYKDSHRVELEVTQAKVAAHALQDLSGSTVDTRMKELMPTAAELKSPRAVGNLMTAFGDSERAPIAGPGNICTVEGCGCMEVTPKFAATGKPYNPWCTCTSCAAGRKVGVAEHVAAACCRAHLEPKAAGGTVLASLSPASALNVGTAAKTAAPTSSSWIGKRKRPEDDDDGNTRADAALQLALPASLEKRLQSLWAAPKPELQPSTGTGESGWMSGPSALAAAAKGPLPGASSAEPPKYDLLARTKARAAELAAKAAQLRARLLDPQTGDDHADVVVEAPRDALQRELERADARAAEAADVAETVAQLRAVQSPTAAAWKLDAPQDKLQRILDTAQEQAASMVQKMVDVKMAAAAAAATAAATVAAAAAAKAVDGGLGASAATDALPGAGHAWLSGGDWKKHALGQAVAAAEGSEPKPKRRRVNRAIRELADHNGSPTAAERAAIQLSLSRGAVEQPRASKWVPIEAKMETEDADDRAVKEAGKGKVGKVCTANGGAASSSTACACSWCLKAALERSMASATRLEQLRAAVEEKLVAAAKWVYEDDSEEL